MHGRCLSCTQSSTCAAWLLAWSTYGRGSSQAPSCEHVGRGSAGSQANTRQTVARSAPGVDIGPGKSTACMKVQRLQLLYKSRHWSLRVLRATQTLHRIVSAAGEAGVWLMFWRRLLVIRFGEDTAVEVSVHTALERVQNSERSCSQSLPGAAPRRAPMQSAPTRQTREDRMRQLPRFHDHCNPVRMRSLAATISPSAAPLCTNLQPLEQPLVIGSTLASLQHCTHHCSRTAGPASVQHCKGKQQPLEQTFLRLSGGGGDGRSFPGQLQ